MSASIEPALKEVKKLMPQIKQQVTQAVEVAQKSMNQLDMKNVSNKITKAVKQIKNKIEGLKKSSKDNDVTIKVNNKEAEKQIKQIEKEIESLQKKISASKMKLSVISPKLDTIQLQTAQQYTPDGVSTDNQAIQGMVQNALNSNAEFKKLSAEEEKVTAEIKDYNQQLDIAKNKLSQLKQEASEVGTSQNKLTSFFSAFKGKLDQAKVSTTKLKSSFNQMPKITQNITNNIKKMSTGVKSGLGHILKYAAALFSLRSIYSALSNSASSWLSSQNAQAQKLSANIEYMKYSMGSVFAPVIEYITNLVYKLMKAIQSLVYAFSGINIFAKATASSMNKTAGSANKASKSLAGVHGEINNVSENDNSSGSGSATPSMDLSQMDTSANNWLEKIKSRFYTIFEPIQNSWNKYGQPLMQSIEYSFLSKIELIKIIGKSFGEVWLNGTGEQTLSLILQILTSIFNICGNISTAFKQAWENDGGTEIVQNLWEGLNNILEIVKGVNQAFEEWTASESFQTFANSITGICKTLSGWFEKLTSKLKEIWDNGGKETFSKLLEFISKLVEAIDVVLKTLEPVIQWILDMVTPVISGIVTAIGYVIDALSGVLDFIIGIFTGDWERAWNGIKEFFVGIWNALKTIVSTVFNLIKDIITGVLNVIKTIWNTVWNGIKTVASNIWNGITTTISNVINGIKNTISNVLNTISTIWSNIWNGIKNAVSNVWNGIWSCIKGVINSILGGIENMVNGVIKGINFILGGISSVANAVGSLIGLDPINLKLNYVSLPRLAKGNVAYSETVAVFGEYAGASNNPEITTPQNVMAETFRDVLSDYQYSNNNSNGELKQIVVQFGSTKVALEIERLLQQARRQNGTAYATI